VTSDGVRLGALCVIDRSPNKITSSQAQILVNFATLVSQEVEREQLSRIVSKAPEKIRGGAPPHQSDFAAGPRRSQRMRAALGEAVLMVNVQSDSILWPILYANEAWTNTTSISLKSSASLTGDVLAEGAGLECAAEGQDSCKNPTLWDWLQLSPDDAMQLLRRVKEQWSQTRPGVFHVGATMKLASKSCRSGAEVAVSCRFSPADFPLDVNASAIRLVPSEDQSEVYGGDNSPPGYLYFVSLSFEWEWSKAALACGPEVHAHQEDTSASESAENRRLRLLGHPQDPSLGNPLMKSAVDSFKAPVPPFHDVNLVRAIAEGAFGNVYFALWCGSPVAVKVWQGTESRLKTTSGRDIDAIVEAATSVQISHPNLVHTFKHKTRLMREHESEAFETWIVQEWCDKGTLPDYLQSSTEMFSLTEIIEICTDIANGGAFLHTNEIIHGALSPNNVLLKGNLSPKKFVCKLCDFGWAKVLEGDSDGIKSGRIGTLTHMPPEILERDRVFPRDVDAWSLKVDVWSFGILLWQVSTRKKLYFGSTWAQVVHRVQNGIRPEFPGGNDDLRSIFDSCTLKDPESRPSFEDILDRLGRVQNA
jgi:hypothetical protein